MSLDLHSRGRIFYAATTLCLTAMLVACGGGSDDALPAGVVTNDFQTIPEGGGYSYALPAGAYLVEVTSNNNGVRISWTNGSGCTNSGEVKVYSGTCTFTSTGQLTVTNPTTLFLGGSENTTIKVTRL